MATVTFIRYKSQSAGALHGVAGYVSQKQKTEQEDGWQLVSDSRTQPELLGDRIVYLLSELMRDRTEFIGTPTELSEQIDPVDVERISPKKVSRQILQNLDALRKIGISAVVRRSNGRRLIELQRAESDDTQGVPAVDPVDPAGALCGDLRAISEYGE